MILDIIIKTRSGRKCRMSFDETLKTICRTNLFGTALKSQCLGYLGRKCQIKKCQVIQPNFFQKEGIWIFGTGWNSGCSLLIN